MPELAYVNGTITAISEAFVPIEDRGYQFGDAIYEFLVTYHGSIFELEAHLDRLQRSMRELSFPPVDREKISQAISVLLQRSKMSRAGIYIQISRGVAPRNHAFGEGLQPQVVMTVRQAAELPEAWRRSGIHVLAVPDIRWGRCDIKTVQLLPNVLAKQKAISAGAQDAVLIGPGDVVREGTSSNVFMARGGALWTHPLTENILPGITRRVLIEICGKENIPVNEAFFRKEELFAADEVFLCGTVTEVLPVIRIDGQVVGGGRPGPLAGRLLQLLRERAGA